METYDDYRQVLEAYRARSLSMSAGELYRCARKNGVSRLHAFVMLRDLYNYNLVECQDVLRDCGEVPPWDTT